MTPAIRLLIDTPAGLAALDAESEKTLLPADLSYSGPRIWYGPYLRAIAGFFTTSSFKALKNLLLKSNAGSQPPLLGIDLISEKHGALYNVCRLDVRFAGKTLPFAVNTALSVEQQAFLEVEFELLGSLDRRFGLPYLPKPYLSGRAECEAENGETVGLRLFACEWFEDYCELHLCAKDRGAGGDPLLRVWKQPGSRSLLDPQKTLSFYRQAACILTSYYDPQTFEQIYPWHHAAGDFIVRENEEAIDVRMITARDYRIVFPDGGADEIALAALHFYLNMTLRMRLDRLDGTGELAWAGPGSIEGAAAGFAESWSAKCREDLALPMAADLFGLWLRLSPEERLSFAELVMEQGLIEVEERDFLSARLADHVFELSAVIEGLV